VRELSKVSRRKNFRSESSIKKRQVQVFLMHLPRRTAPILCAVILFAVVILSSGIPGRAQEQKGEPIRVGVNLVLLDATVKTKTGQIMGDLKKEDFEVREDGVRQKIDVFGVDQLPLNVALVLDLSGSMGPYLGPLRDAAKVTLTSLKPDDQVALFTFATTAQMRLPLTHDKAQIADLIKTFKAGGMTDINDGIFEAAKYFLSLPPNGRRVIVLISDDMGTDAGNQGTEDIVMETVAANAALYNLRIPGFSGASNLLHEYRRPGLVNIRKVMDETGGEMFDVKQVEDLAEQFGALMNRIRTRYTLGYYTTAEVELQKPHKLEVRLAPSFGSKGKAYTVLSRNSFFVQ
jgi:VWFA-related protein